MARSPAPPSTAEDSIPLTLLTEDCSKSTHGVLSISSVNICKKGRKETTSWRAVLRVTGEAGRYFGTRHREAVQSAQNLLSRMNDRISDAERNRVLEVVQCVPGPSTHGSQPSLVLCRRLRGKRKINETDIVKNRLDAKKLAINFNQGASVGVVKNRDETKKPAINSNQGARIEKRKVAGLHYLLRIPLLQAEEDLEADDVVKPAPLLLFLHGSGERGSDDGRELSLVRKHGPWECDGADDFFILAPQCPRKRVWPAFVNEVLLLLKDVCERHVVDKSRVYITGLSMGAFGAWSVAATQPQMFAAIVPICGGFMGVGVPVQTTRAQMLRSATGLHWCRKRQMAFKKCKGMSVWLFHGMKDKVVDPKASEEVFDALGGTSNENVRKTIYPNTGHQCWGKTYNKPELYAWLERTSVTTLALSPVFKAYVRQSSVRTPAGLSERRSRS